ncbi:MAG: HD domain-containing protein [Treponema sp.]|nr:HD domain-containing protein [Treponema sp.]MCL2273015.1 HD domain-containing protein [Treponema sp.]
MTFRMDSLIVTITSALDSVEKELLGASSNHGKRIAVLCTKMGKLLGKNTKEISGLTNCALLHDNALTEYILATRMGGHYDSTMKKHCEYGQRNADLLGFNTNINNFILYHHERADGKGPYGIFEGGGPVEAELIAIADSIDVVRHLQNLKFDDLASVQKTIREETGKKFGKIAAQAMLEVMDWPTVESLKDEFINETSGAFLVPWVADMEDKIIFNLVNFITRIIDYKSVFTKHHSTQIANMAYLMGKYYNYNQEEIMKLYLASALHDLGKLETPTAILEKPGKLTDDEFLIIKKHVFKTRKLLENIDGFQDICEWASNHHEKLNGTGYPFGKKADELDFNSRLMTCIDIYQAVREERPYHPPRSHKGAILLLDKMADNGETDKSIVNDISIAMAPYDGTELPSPESVKSL